MRVDHLRWASRSGWIGAHRTAADPALVLFFGDRFALADGARFRELRALYPTAHIVGGTTGGQIDQADVRDDEVIATAVEFSRSRVRLVTQAGYRSGRKSAECGRRTRSRSRGRGSRREFSFCRTDFR